MIIMTASNEWAKRPEDQRFSSIHSLYNHVLRRKTNSTQYAVPLRSIGATVIEGELYIDNDYNTLRPTNWSFGQLCSWLRAGEERLPRKYLQGLPPKLAAHLINHATANTQNRPLAMFNEAQAGLLQAVTSTKYARIFDEEVVAWIRATTQGTTWKLPLANPPGTYTGKAASIEEGGVPSGAYASDRDVFIFMVDETNVVEVDGDVLKRGFFVWNSEVGNSSFGVSTFLYRLVCGNHIVHGAQDLTTFRQIHVGNRAGARARAHLNRVLDEYRHRSTQNDVELISAAKRINVGASFDEAVKWLRTKRFSQKFAEKACHKAEREEGGCGTLWEVVQGLTSAARDIPHRDVRASLERQAGNLLKGLV